MSADERAAERPRSQPRRLDRVFFYTSSMEKYLQARLLFDRSGLAVDYFKSKTEPYDEDYEGSTEDLLAGAINQVVSQVGIGSLVFVEDTSVRVEALSSDEDFPGMRVKHWFAETSFAEVDSEVRDRGNDRRVVVKSDIALKLPGLDRPIFFHGETHGELATSEPTFAPNTQYPWLTPNTFNGWIIPDGYDEPLGAFPLEESLRVDFRARSIRALLDRLQEYAAALNLPPSAYRRSRPLRRPSVKTPTLFDNHEPALLVVGRTCAGKTTFAEYASSRHGIRMIEASKVVRSLGVPKLPTDDSDGFAYAMRVLDTLGHDIVARTIIDDFGVDLEQPFLVSGLRDIHEVRLFRSAVPRVRLVLIEASERTRFERHILRGRPGAETTLKAFAARDSKQDMFGLLPVVDDLADSRLHNEGRLDEYHRQIDALLNGESSISGVETHATPRHGPVQHQLFRCLRILVDAEHPLQCDEIEHRSASGSGRKIRHNNANKVLRAVPMLARRIDGESREEDSARVRYDVTEAGRVFVELFLDRFSNTDA